MPFRKVENCNQVINIGKKLRFSLVNVAGNDIVQGNKKLILGNYPLPQKVLNEWQYEANSYIYFINVFYIFWFLLTLSP